MGATTDKIKGAANEAIGKAKQGIGEATGSERLQGEGVDPGSEGQGPAGAGRCQGCDQGCRQQGRRRRQQEALIATTDRDERPAPFGPVFPCVAGARRRKRSCYFTASSSTSNISVAFGGMTPPAPRAP